MADKTFSIDIKAGLSDPGAFSQASQGLQQVTQGTQELAAQTRALGDELKLTDAELEKMFGITMSKAKSGSEALKEWAASAKLPDWVTRGPEDVSEGLANLRKAGAGHNEEEQADPAAASAAAGRITGALSTINTGAMTELRSATRAIHFLEHELGAIGGPEAMAGIKQLNLGLEKAFNETFQILTGIRVSQFIENIKDAIGLETRAMAEAHGPIEGYINIHKSIETACENVKKALENEAKAAKQTAIEMEGSLKAFDKVNTERVKALEEWQKKAEADVANSTATEAQKAADLLKIHEKYLNDKRELDANAAISEKFKADAALEAAADHKEKLTHTAKAQADENAKLNAAITGDDQVRQAREEKKKADEAVEQTRTGFDSKQDYDIWVKTHADQVEKEHDRATRAAKQLERAEQRSKDAHAALPRDEHGRTPLDGLGNEDPAVDKKNKEAFAKKQEEGAKEAEKAAKKAQDELDLAKSKHAVEIKAIEDQVASNKADQAAKEQALNQERINANLKVPQDVDPDQSYNDARAEAMNAARAVHAMGKPGEDVPYGKEYYAAQKRHREAQAALKREAESKQNREHGTPVTEDEEEFAEARRAGGQVAVDAEKARRARLTADEAARQARIKAQEEHQKEAIADPHHVGDSAASQVPGAPGAGAGKSAPGAPAKPGDGQYHPVLREIADKVGGGGSAGGGGGGGSGGGHASAPGQGHGSGGAANAGPATGASAPAAGVNSNGSYKAPSQVAEDARIAARADAEKTAADAKREGELEMDDRIFGTHTAHPADAATPAPQGTSKPAPAGEGKPGHSNSAVTGHGQSPQEMGRAMGEAAAEPIAVKIHAAVTEGDKAKMAKHLQDVNDAKVHGHDLVVGMQSDDPTQNTGKGHFAAGGDSGMRGYGMGSSPKPADDPAAADPDPFAHQQQPHREMPAGTQQVGLPDSSGFAGLAAMAVHMGTIAGHVGDMVSTARILNTHARVTRGRVDHLMERLNTP